jgi:hypothetical protein
MLVLSAKPVEPFQLFESIGAFVRQMKANVVHELLAMPPVKRI